MAQVRSVTFALSLKEKLEKQLREVQPSDDITPFINALCRLYAPNVAKSTEEEKQFFNEHDAFNFAKNILINEELAQKVGPIVICYFFQYATGYVLEVPFGPFVSQCQELNHSLNNPDPTEFKRLFNILMRNDRFDPEFILKKLNLFPRSEAVAEAIVEKLREPAETKSRNFIVEQFETEMVPARIVDQKEIKEILVEYASGSRYASIQALKSMQPDMETLKAVLVNSTNTYFILQNLWVLVHWKVSIVNFLSIPSGLFLEDSSRLVKNKKIDIEFLNAFGVRAMRLSNGGSLSLLTSGLLSLYQFSMIDLVYSVECKFTYFEIFLKLRDNPTMLTKDDLAVLVNGIISRLMNVAPSEKDYFYESYKTLSNITSDESEIFNQVKIWGLLKENSFPIFTKKLLHALTLSMSHRDYSDRSRDPFAPSTYLINIYRIKYLILLALLENPQELFCSEEASADESPTLVERWEMFGDMVAKVYGASPNEYLPPSGGPFFKVQDSGLLLQILAAYVQKHFTVKVRQPYVVDNIQAFYRGFTRHLFSQCDSSIKVKETLSVLVHARRLASLDSASWVFESEHKMNVVKAGFSALFPRKDKTGEEKGGFSLARIKGKFQAVQEARREQDDLYQQAKEKLISDFEFTAEAANAFLVGAVEAGESAAPLPADAGAASRVDGMASSPSSAGQFSFNAGAAGAGAGAGSEATAVDSKSVFS
jgi:hypothetical protein